MVHIGNGLTAEFSNSTWLEGKAPRDIPPNLYKLAWRKHRKVQEEVTDQNWTRGLWRMGSITEMVEFVTLWPLVQTISFTDSPDEIVWRWTTDGNYSAKSDYLIQFKSTFCSF